MNKAIGYILSFAFGFGIAVAFVKHHYDNLPIDDIHKEACSDLKKENSPAKNEDATVRDSSEDDINDYIVQASEYQAGITVISPDEFGEDEDFERITLTYYEDGILADDSDEPMKNADDTIGIEALDSFGKYEEDTVYVRNTYLRCYYEIIRDDRSFGEATGVGIE